MTAKYNPGVSIMAIDYGSRRIGVAVSESGTIATPLATVRNEGDVVATLAHIASEQGAETIVLGVPRQPHGGRGEEKFHDFAERLRQKTCREVFLWDETLTTREASRQLRERGMNRRDAQREIDMHAAAVILQSYLDDLARRQS